MNTHRIQIALKIAETQSISKAAAALFLTQPSVSSALNALEAEIGFRIFERNNKGLKITEKGHEFLYSANIIADQLEYISHLAKQSGYCRLHLMSFLNQKVNDAFYTFCKNHKDASNMDVCYSFFSLSVEDAARTLRESRADVAIAMCREDRVEQVLFEQEDYAEVCLLGSQESYVVMSPQLPLAHEELTAENLKRYNVVLFEDYRYSNYYIPLGDSEKLKFPKTIMVQSGELGRYLVQQGIGILFCEEENLPRMEQYGLLCRPLGVRTAFLCMYKTSKKTNPDIQEFIQLLRENFATTSQAEA